MPYKKKETQYGTGTIFYSEDRDDEKINNVIAPAVEKFLQQILYRSPGNAPSGLNIHVSRTPFLTGNSAAMYRNKSKTIDLDIDDPALMKQLMHELSHAVRAAQGRQLIEETREEEERFADEMMKEVE